MSLVKEKQTVLENPQEHFVPEHVFFYVIEGTINWYDGNKSYLFKSKECFLIRKNRLARFQKRKSGIKFDKVIVFFDEKFLRGFQEKYSPASAKFNLPDTFIKTPASEMLADFIGSIKPYYLHGKIDDAFADLKREELLLILLRDQPAIGGLLFNYNNPAKINLEEFMNRNYKFNVSIPRFAYLTGRSLSAFKRDFITIFNQTPNRWLVQKRLQEAYFLIKNKQKKPSEIYLDLGFEDFTHFLFAFKKSFGLTPGQLTTKNKTAT